MSDIKKILVIFLILATPFFITNSYGHGIGYEVLPSVKIGDKSVALEVSSSQYQNPDSPDREITFALFDTDGGITVRDVTYSIEASKKDQVLFDNTFTTTDGILVMDFLHGDSDKILVKQESKTSFFDTLLGVKKDVIRVSGKPFNTGGLYSFKVSLLIGDQNYKKLEEPIKYNVGLSIPQRDFYDVKDPNFGIQQLSVITYYDEIENFQYEPLAKSLSFTMPFEWNLENINQTSIVHEELTIPKTFGELMVSEYSVKVNGIEIPQRAITLDEFSETQRIIHIVLNNNDLVDLYKNQKNHINKIDFLLKPLNENLPLSTVTGNGQFRIVLNWEPRDVASGADVKFYFDILDVFLKDRPISVSYNLSIVHDNTVIFTQNGISTASKNEHNVVEFTIPEDIKGVITLQFDNLDGNNLARVGLPIVVDKTKPSAEVSIPDWVRNNAKWWSEGQISDDDFAGGLQFLIKAGIISV